MKQLSRWLVVTLLLGSSLALAVGPPPVWRELTAAEKRQVEVLERRAAEAGDGADFAAAVRAGEQILRIREQARGKKDWRTLDFRDTVDSWRRIAGLPLEKRKRMLEAIDVGTREIAWQMKGDFVRAERLARQHLAMVRAIVGEDSPDTALAYNAVAKNLMAQGHYVKAQALLEKAVASCLGSVGEDSRDTALSYAGLASCLDWQGKRAEAQRLHEKALAINRRVLGEDHPRVATGYTNVAINRYEQGDLDSPVKLLEKALAITRRAYGENDPQTGLMTMNLASHLSAQGKHVQAQLLHEKAVAILEQAPPEDTPPKWKIDAYQALAKTLINQRKHAQAQVYLVRALALTLTALGEGHPQAVAAYANAAVNLDAQGKTAEAQPLFNKALAISIKALGENHPSTARAYTNVAANLDHLRKHEQALPLHEKGLTLTRDLLGKDHSDVAHCCIVLASNLASQGKREQAQALFDEALAIRRKRLGEEHPALVSAYIKSADNLQHLGKHAGAQKRYEKALAISRRILGEVHPTTATARISLARNLARHERYEAAVAHLRQALSGYEIGRLESNVAGFDRSQFTRESREPHTLLAVCLAHLGKAEDAWQHAEAELARGLLDDLSSSAAGSEEVAASARARRDVIDKQLLPLLRSSELSARDRQRRDALLGERKKVTAELVEWVTKRSEEQVWKRADIQKQISADTAVVFWFGLFGHHYGCVLRSEGLPRFAPLVGTGPKGAWIREDQSLPDRLYRSLVDPDSSGTGREKLVAAVRKQRIEPIRGLLAAQGRQPAIKRLVVVPTRAMARVPVELLAPEYTVSYAPSGSVYARLVKEHRPVSDGSLLALGDPIFDRVKPPDPPSVGVLVTAVLPGSNAEKAGLQPGDVLLSIGGKKLGTPDDLKEARKSGPAVITFWREGKQHKGRLPGGRMGAVMDPRSARAAVRAWRRSSAAVALRGTGHKRLPETKNEVEAIARLVKGGLTLLGSDASEQALDELRRRKKLKTFHIIHLATHGEANEQEPGRSALILAQDRLPDRDAQVRQGKKPYDGRLTVAAIGTTWDLDADLVVLSACETGLGPDAGGEGLLGFAQAFLSRGARSVVLSRWKVHDLATALLMVRFYENLLGKRKGVGKMGRAVALAEAKRWLAGLKREEAGLLAARYAGGVLRGTEGDERPVRPLKAVKVPEGERPFAHPFYWAAFVLVGDPD
jgi:tetratricopeptide (TPR) repeat protein